MSQPIDRVVEELQAIRKQLGGTDEVAKICVRTIQHDAVHEKANAWKWDKDILNLYVDDEVCAQYRRSAVVSVSYVYQEG